MQKDMSETIHWRNIKILASELFEIKKNLSNDVMGQLFWKETAQITAFVNKTVFCLTHVESVN